jgi:putative hemolysin
VWREWLVEILLLLVLILTNAMLAMSEVALLTSKRSKLSSMAAQGKKSAALALRVSEKPTEFLSAIQIGITSIGLFSGIVGESVFAQPLSIWLQSMGLSQNVSDISSTVFVVLIVTYVSITIGELVPKRIGQTRPEVIASLMSPPLLLISKIAKPFVFALSASTNGILKLFGVDKHVPATVTEEEIEAILEEGSIAGLIEAQERDIVRNVFRLDERRLGSLMVPRSEIVFVDLASPEKDNLNLIAESPHSKIPVCDGGLENIVGVLSAKAALAAVARGSALSLTQNLESAVFLPETLTGMGLLDEFRLSRKNIAFVVNEYGGLEGLVTLQDILDSLVGEMGEDGDQEYEAVRRDDGSWLLDGSLAIPEFKDALGLISVPQEEKWRYHTLSGLILLLLGRLPSPGDHVVWESWRLEVVDMDGRRIDKVLAIRT